MFGPNFQAEKSTPRIVSCAWSVSFESGPRVCVGRTASHPFPISNRPIAVAHEGSV